MAWSSEIWSFLKACAWRCTQMVFTSIPVFLSADATSGNLCFRLAPVEDALPLNRQETRQLPQWLAVDGHIDLVVAVGDIGHGHDENIQPNKGRIKSGTSDSCG